jgi:Tfp pilus assembly protein PilO
VGLPTAADAGGKLATLPMSVTVKGSYAQLSAFLKAAELLPRAWLIDSVAAQGEEGGVINLTASGSLFVLDTTGIAVPPSSTGA